ncbi:MAG: hypothetical protein ACREF1_04980, partial [Acetobacteraceae bacterium]
MIQEFDRSRQVYVNRDAQGIARELLHFDHPVQIVERTPQLAAGDYLRRFGDLLGITASQLANLANPPSATLTQDGVEYRRLSEKSQFDTVTIALA